MKRFDGFKAGLEISDEEYKWIDFSLDKTYQAMFEAGKQFKELFAAYLVIVIVSWILTYSKGAATEPGTSTVKVPLLDLLLDRRHAAIAAVVIATGILVALVCLVVYEEVLRWRAEGLVLIRYGAISQVGDVPSDNYWYLRFPSLLRMSLFLSGSQTIIENVFAYVFLLIFGNRIIFSWDVRMESRQTAFVALPSTAWANCRCLHITVSGDTFVDHCVSSCSGRG